MKLPVFVNKVLFMPFVARGRGYDGGDCWAVVWLLWRDVLGRELPAYDTQYATAGASAVDRAVVSGIMARERVKWKKIDAPRLGDVALLRCSGRNCHVGVMLDDNSFLHIEDRRGAMVEKLSNPIWQRRCEGVYRLAE